MNVLQIIYIPHKRNNRKADFVHITTESGRDIKMTLAHIIPAGKCSDDSLPLSLPLAYAEKGEFSRKNDGILCSISFLFSLFLSFLFCFFVCFFFSICFHCPRLMRPVKSTSLTQSLTCFLSLTPTR